MNTTPPPQLPPSPKSGLAVTSLVLGILAIIPCGIFTAIPAIITGHIAHSRAKRSPAQFGGAGLGVAGFVMGYVSLALSLLIMPALLLPAFARAKEQAESIRCVNQLKMISISAHAWASGHNGRLPLDFASFQTELGDPKILRCVRDKERSAAATIAEVGPENISYVIVSPGASVTDVSKVFVRCPIHGHEGMVDGSVQVKPLERRAP